MTTTSDQAVEPLDEAEMTTWRALLGAHSRVVRRLESELEAEHGLSMAVYEVLVNLSAAPERRLRMTELARHAILSPSGLTRLVDKLVREGLVERQRCGGDARVVYAWLTPAGLAKLETAYPTHLRGVREHFLDWLTKDQQDALGDALKELSEVGLPKEACAAADAELEAIEAAGCDQAEAAAAAAGAADQAAVSLPA